jgi:hypothetical protein
MRAAPPPTDWEPPLEDTSITAHHGSDGLWHLGMDTPGWHPYVATACGADLAPLTDLAPSSGNADWTDDLSRVDCPWCAASPWMALGLQRDPESTGRYEAGQ